MTDASISVTGTGIVETIPDRANIELTFQAVGIEGDDTVPDGPVRRANEALAWLQELGEAVVASGPHLSTYLHRDGRRREKVVSVRLSANVQGPEIVCQVVNYALDHADSVGGPHWSISHEDSAHRQARIAAVHKAREAAEDYAQAAGRRLGALMSISDQGASSLTPRLMTAAPMARMAAEHPMLDIADPTPQEVTASVHLVYRLES